MAHRQRAARIAGAAAVLGEDRVGVLAGRLDQASAFERSGERIFLPSVGVSYIVSEEPAWQGFAPSFISTLKLRAAYGETGRSPASTA